jgi:hypothetical protein
MIKPFALALLTSCLFFGSTAEACSFIAPESAAAHLKAADAIFIGRAIKTRPSGYAHGFGELATTFAVTRTIKGEPARRREVFHDKPGSTCGLLFETGKTYPILTHKVGRGEMTGTSSMPFFPVSDYDRAANGPL